MKKYYNGTFLVIAFLFHSSFADPGTPKDYIEMVSQAMFATTELGSAAERVPALESVIEEYFDLGVVARGVVGQHRESLTDEQMSRFEVEFQNGLVNLISTALEEIDDYELTVQAPRMRGDDRAQVPAIVDTGSQGTFEFQFSLAVSDDRWNVLNLIVNGVNLGLTYRNQFNELMLSNDHDVDAVITGWRETVAESAPDL